MNPITPMRPVPGAFLNTPGPGTRLFGDTTNGNSVSGFGTRQPSATTAASSALSAKGGGTATSAAPGGLVGGSAGGLPPRDELPPVVKAAQSINQTLQLDESYPDLDSYCRPGASSEYDIQFADAAWAPFQKGNTYSIPDQVFAHLNEGEVHTKLGLFSSIGYAWASIDSSLFLWDYTHPSPELIGYEEATHTITAVALVPPKPGVFVSTITHILVLATTTEVILLGLSATPTPSGSKTVTLYQTKMSVHRGGSDVSIITGTASGRIFYGGESDTDIYELSYQQEERWFSSRCGKVNHTRPGWTSVVPILGNRLSEHLVDIVVDNTRNLVYSLSNRSTIRTYHMETPDRLTKVIEKDKHSCLRDITHMIDRSTLLLDQASIVSLCPITATEASKLHLMAITDAGCRLFLSATSSASYIMGATSSLAPQSMQVQFVKFPPREPVRQRRPNATGQYPDSGLDAESHALDASVFGHRFAPGYFFDAVRNPGATDDLLFVSAPDTGRIKITTPTSALKYFEQGNYIPMNGRILAIGPTTSAFAAAKQPLGFGNELAVQFDQAPGEFAVLTNTGVQIIRRRRLVDVFATAMRGAGSEEVLDKEVRKFITQYGRVETISAALAVACGQGSDLRSGTSRANDQATEDRARTAFVEYGGQPRLNEVDGNQITADSVRLSSRHDALALYLARLTRVLWRAKVVTIQVGKATIAVSSTVPKEKLVAVQENIERLRTFLEANKGMIQGLAGPSNRIASRQEEIALQKEHQALHSLRKLMESVSEGISFVLMLFDERVSDIYARLDDQSKQRLKELTYENLFSQTPGKELAKVLVKAIVNRNIANGANVETVADALRRRCGSFCSPDDVVIFKAQEQLQRGMEQAQNPATLRTLLAESLRLFEQVAGSLSADNLEAAVDQYVGLKYYAGAIQLCLTVAKQKDRGNTALSWVNEGKPANDPRQKAFLARESCYNLIHEVLDRLETASALEPDTVDGRPTLAATKRREAYEVVNGSDDEVFHFNLYDWYITKGWTDRILASDSLHVITYLQRLAASGPQAAELLCRFYTARSRFFEGAQVQVNLAKSEFDIGIKDRINLLSRAKANASVQTTGVSRQQQQLLNHEVTELLDIAHIQDDLLSRLQADHRIPAEKIPEIEQALDGPIQNLTELFNNYADQAGYYDICLLIFHAADYQNPRVIAETWENLITETHCDVVQRREYWETHRAGRPLPAGAPVPTCEPPMPYESVTSQIHDIAHRTSLDSLIFPVDTLLPLVCAYALNHGQDASIGADPSWPVLVFLHLGVPHTLLVHVLEGLFDAQEAPFTGKRRKLVVIWIHTAVDAWIKQVERHGSLAGKGGEIGTINRVIDLLGRCDEAMTQTSAGTRNNADAEEAMQIRQGVRALKREVERMAALESQGSLYGRN
ncbi:Non-repetitive/WGA-negative nucleoporin C-terminal-domain-containing protein [Podospora conica]|nr:Non-repetitive/WGA-negative nucleoporin C-terminal-domain-containing protein [Schizothecium conicum]